MSDRKAAGCSDPLDRLASIEAPEFLDQLVLGQALPLLARHANRPEAEARASKPAAAPAAAFFARLTLPRLKSS